MAGEIVRTYVPDQVSVAFGPHLLTDFAKGTFVTVARVEPGFTVYEGSDGKVARAAKRSKLGTMKVRLMTSSPSNDVLSAYYNADQLTPGAGVQSAQVKDGSGTSLAMARNAWINKLPDFERAQEIGEVEWEFDLAAVDVHIGGTLAGTRT